MPEPRDHVFWHELRSPAGTLQTLLNVMADGYAGKVPDELRDLLERARRQSGRLMEMIGAAHDVDRLRGGRLLLTATPIDLAAAIRQAFQDAESAGAAKQLAVSFEGATGLSLADPIQLPRCLATMARAAIEAAGRETTVKVQLAPTRVALQIEPPEALALALDPSCSLGIRGGFGLSLCEIALLATAMGGALAVRGGLLELALPAAPATP